MDRHTEKSVLVISRTEEGSEGYKSRFEGFGKILSLSVDVRTCRSSAEALSLLKDLFPEGSSNGSGIGLVVLESDDPDLACADFQGLNLSAPCIILSDRVSCPLWKEDTIVVLPDSIAPDGLVLYADLVTKFSRVREERDFLKRELVETQKALAALTTDFTRKITEQASILMMSEKMASVGLFAAGIAHEVNTPISFISGNLYAIEDRCSLLEDIFHLHERLRQEAAFGVDTGETRRLIGERTQKSVSALFDEIKGSVNKTRDSAADIMRVISGFLSFSHADAVDRGLSDIAEILEDGIAKTPGLSADMIEIRRMYTETPKIPCFHGKLVIAFVNILTNAVQAIRKYGTVTIEVSPVRTGRREEDVFVQVRISDTGCGIPTHDLPHVFDPFFTTRTYGEGNGLGLNIVYDIVRIHGGTIQIESVEGEGTTCTVRLPIKLPEKRERSSSESV